MKAVILLALFVGVALCSTPHVRSVSANAEAMDVDAPEAAYRKLFSFFQNKFNRLYGNLRESERRFNIFKKNVDTINHHNRHFAETLGYTMGLNKFADLHPDEFAAKFLGTIPVREQRNVATHLASNATEPATSWDWRQKGAVTPVKDQGQCGSCWSFSATGSMEGAHFLATGKLVGLSEQNLVDCSTAQGNMGCNGGLMDYAFEYVIQNGGIDTEASYPYTATGPNSCQYSASSVGATISSYQDIPRGSESALTTAINTKGPVSIAVDARQWQFYNGGIFSSSACSSTQLDHGVLAVGYGSASGKDFYIVKNSWSDSWGESGYIRVARNANNMCGVATAASYPIV